MMTRSFAGKCSVSIIVMLALLGAGIPAMAYPQVTNNCSDDSLTWAFSQDPQWTTDKKNWVRAGIQTIDDALDYDGTRLVTQSEGGGGVLVKIAELGGTTNGTSECQGDPTITIDDDGTTKEFHWRWARHEILHLAGADHGGRYDSFDGVTISSVSTCVTPLPATNQLEQDASGYENYLWSSIGQRPLHANVGYEQGLKFWGKSGGGTTQEYSSGGATGPGYIGWVSTSTSAYIFQSIRAHNGTLVLREFRSKVNARSPAATYTTRVSGKLFRRTVDFSGSVPQNCVYPLGIDYDPNQQSPSLGGWILMSDTPFTLVGTSWTAVTGPWTDPPTQDAYDFQIRFFGTAVHNSTGAYGQVQLDNVRGESS
jgi:hypothetical protein